MYFKQLSNASPTNMYRDKVLIYLYTFGPDVALHPVNLLLLSNLYIHSHNNGGGGGGGREQGRLELSCNFLIVNLKKIKIL